MAYYRTFTHASPSNSAEARYARMFGTWTLLSSIIRVCAAWTLQYNSGFYALAMGTYALATSYFLLERMVYGVDDAKALPAGAVAIVTVMWMWLESGSSAGP